MVACGVKGYMMRVEFNGKLELDWISVDDRLPLDEYPESKYGLIADVLILINNEDDPNEDVAIVNIQYQNTDKKWVWFTGEEYPNCHVKNIKYWCYPPYYTNKSVTNYDKSRTKN